MSDLDKSTVFERRPGKENERQSEKIPRYKPNIYVFFESEYFIYYVDLILFNHIIYNHIFFFFSMPRFLIFTNCQI